MAELLNPLTLPLRGARLIEASAGTGKTWTIAALYLRLVLGHGLDHGDAASAPPRPLLPPEILVMTFTRAATRELAERIRDRLARAAAALRGDPSAPDAQPDPQSDPYLDALLADLSEGRDAEDTRQRAAFRLAQAAEAMDEAAIHTIDAWCQRVLREHALSSGAALDEALVADEAALRHEAVRDHWRATVYPLGPAQFAAWQRAFPSVDRLAQALSQSLPKLEAVDEAPEDTGHGSPAEQAIAVLSADAAELAALKAGWAEGAAEMLAFLAPLAARKDKDKPFDGRKVRLDWLEDWCAKLAAWATDAAALEPGLSDKAWQRLTPEGLMEALREGAHLPLPAVFERFAALRQALHGRVPLAARLLGLATRAVARRVAELKQRQQVFGFADPLRRLEAALASPQGPALRERLLAQYPVALIDEFQDTSPRQWRVFERLYLRLDLPAEPAVQGNDTALLLIGDPKQSIYGFRGADIYSYLRARAATAPRHHALGTNHRATAALVAVVNSLFAQAEQRCEAGAFAQGKGHALALPFEPVAARGRAETLLSSAGPVPAATLCHGAELLPAEGQRRLYAALAAEQVVAWLNDPGCGFERPGEPFERLKPAHIAVLVRSRTEAEAVRAALSHRGVASVFLSDQASVFEAPEAADLLRWLQAVAEPLNARLARAAFASPSLGLSWQALAAQAADEATWDARIELLRELQRAWQRQGVLAMLRQSLHRLGLPARRLAEPGGERALTNLLHLAELLQAASAQLEGEQALIRWLAERLDEARAGQADSAGLGDERIVRLESDEGLVQVVTVHKSKGLEYPVVLLPFASAAPPAVRADSVLSLVDGAGRRRLVFHPSDADRDAATAERLREDLRLLYVALTRARHALWLGVGLQAPRGARGAQDGGEPPVLHASALGHLLGGGQPLAAGDVAAALQQALDGPGVPAEAVRLVAAELPAQRGQLRREEAAVALLPPPPYRASFDRDWAVGSYSGLVRGLSTDGGAAQAAAWTRPLRDEGVDEATEVGEVGEVDEATGPAGPGGAAGSSAEPARARAPWHRFPRGALPGNFLHDQLQWLVEEGLLGQLHEPTVRQALTRRCERAGHGGERAQGVCAWLQAVAATPLPGPGAALAGLTHRVAELEFWMPSEALHAPTLDALVREHLLPGVPRPDLPARHLRGLLMGFADLVFEHAGRWWVLDYKSNALGDDDRAYRAPLLAAAVAEHRYEVQAALYLAALHRHLRARLGAAYEPSRQLGGAVVLFLRGIQAPRRGCVVLPAPLGLLEGLDRLLGGGEGAR